LHTHNTMHGKFLFCLLFLLLSVKGFGVDTLKIVHYNLLRYGDATCSPLANKDNWLNTIIGHAQPDILGVNEIINEDAYARRVLNLFTVNQKRPTMKRIAFVNTSANSDIVSTLFYDSKKLELKKQAVAQNLLRDIPYVKLYYKSDDLAKGGDTVFIHIFIAHLKAGNTASDANQRKVMAENMMKYVVANNIIGNVLVMGDFNTYTASEDCFQNFVAPADLKYKFNDPADKMGDWAGNSTYKYYHSQSTRVSDVTGCASGGGMNDRFDHILISTPLLSQTNNIHIIPSSFKYMGQDGNRFNGDLLANNTSGVPNNVLQAEYNMSDHLPVLMSLEINKNRTSIYSSYSLQNVKAWYGVGKSQINITSVNVEPLSLIIYNTMGVQVLRAIVNSNGNYDMSALPVGTYTFTVTNSKGQQLINRFLKY